jgi:hypothetical protein
MSKDTDPRSNQEQTDGQTPSTDPATTDDASSKPAPSSTGAADASVFYTTAAGGGEPEQGDRAAASAAAICARLAESDLPEVPTASPPEKTMILAPSGDLAEDTATYLEDRGYDVHRRGNLGDHPDLIDRTIDYLTVLAAPSQSDRDGELKELLEYFYDIPASRLADRVEAAGHDPDEFDDTWSQLTTVANTGADPGALAERAALAKEDIETVRAEVGHRSIQVAFARLHDHIHLREYATEQETAGLAVLANAVTDGTWVQTDTTVESAPPLSVQTVRELGRKVNEARNIGPAEAPPGHFQVGTIHSAKGDEAHTVVLVGLSDHWPRALSNEDRPENFSRAVTEFTDDVGSSADNSFEHRQHDNARLLMYVAVSRAKERLFLLGGAPDDPDVTPPTNGDHEVPDALAAVKDALPDVTGSTDHLPWSELLSSLPDSAVELGDHAGEATRARFRCGDTPITEEGAADFLRNQTDAAASDQFTIRLTSLDSTASCRPRPLTYSALKTAADDPADYYWRHVLGEPDLDLPKTVPDDERLREHLDVHRSSSSVRRRVVGDLVHFTAETLYGTDADVDEWKARCAAIADTIEASTAEQEQAIEHIERLFATDAMKYTVRGTELRVAPEVDGDPVYGRVDAVVEHPERPDELLALDFKTGQRAHADAMQLWFYLLGLDESDQFDRSVTEAAFVYLDDTPEVADHVTVDDTGEEAKRRAEFESWVATATDVTHEVLNGGSD